GLVATTASNDTTAPASTITAPSAGSSLPGGLQVTVTGTASDTGGGVVAGVEVSFDGGSTWHKANLASALTSITWSYNWFPQGQGSVTIRGGAVDDSGTIEPPTAGISVTVTPRVCPCSLFPSTATPGVVATQDASSVELGVKFTADTPGFISGVKF